MPRAKRASDEIYNERRRQKRALARMKRAGTISKEGAVKVETQIAQTYQTTRKRGNALKETIRQTRALSKSRAVLTEERKTARNYRSDKVMQISMRAAHGKSGTSKRISDIFNSVAEEQGSSIRAVAKEAKALMRIFWTSTQRLWQRGGYDENGKPLYATPEDRLGLIKSRLGVNTIEEAMRKVFSSNFDALQRYQETGYGSEEESTARYPDFLHWIQYVEV